ncbi:uncharacterized protein LOC144919665 isoform X1 [Branchiostoma floridae x Branchiostoma belcheri]
MAPVFRKKPTVVTHVCKECIGESVRPNMLSIPDWVRGRTADTPKSLLSRSRFDRLRENDAIRTAEERGYLLSPSKSFVLEQCLGKSQSQSREDRQKIYDIQIVRMTQAHLRNIGYIQSCTRLQVCILSNNYITRFDALAACTMLVKLDLHSNQVSVLPSAQFWEGMERLKVLFLHDNPIGRLDCLHNLGSCPSLVVLTMYDTPLSLRASYRHHVVNTIWSLKVLDNYLISDEEIIEDSNFGGRFCTLHPSLFINVGPNTRRDATLEEELEDVNDLLQAINVLLAHCSPVLVIQRWVRGHLGRQTVARMRGQQRRPTPKKPEAQKEATPPPPTSPIPQTARSTTSNVGLDYDTYMQNRRPGSRPQSPSVVSEKQAVMEGKVDDMMRLSAMDREEFSPQKALPPPVPTPITPAATPTGDGSFPRRNLHINLNKLQEGMLQTLDQNEAITIEIVKRLESGPSSLGPPSEGQRSGRDRRAKSEQKKQRKVYKTVQQLLGPQRDLDQKPIVDTPVEESEVQVQFRLSGLKPMLHAADAVQEMLIAKREGAEDIRSAERVHREYLASQPQPKLPPKQVVTLDQRLFSKAQGTMGMTCFKAVQQAYKDRKRAAQIAEKMEQVMAIKDQREQAKNRVQGFMHQKRNNALRKREKDGVEVSEALEKHELKHINYIEKRYETRGKAFERTKARFADLAFMADFSSQHTSVSNALLRHDRQTRKEDDSSERKDKYRQTREQSQEQKELVRRYLEHRQLMRQAEVSTERSVLDSKMLQDANNRLMEARVRVAQLKQRTATVQAFYPLPQTGSPSFDVAESKSPPLPPVGSVARSPDSSIRHQMMEGRMLTLNSNLNQSQTVATQV